MKLRRCLRIFEKSGDLIRVGNLQNLNVAKKYFLLEFEFFFHRLKGCIGFLKKYRTAGEFKVKKCLL